MGFHKGVYIPTTVCYLFVLNATLADEADKLS